MVSLNYETIATNYIRFKQAERLKKTSFDLQIMNKQLGWVWVKNIFQGEIQFLESLEGRGREGWRQNYSLNLKISREFSDPLTVNRTENASDILIIICYFLKAASLGVYFYIVH